MAWVYWFLGALSYFYQFVFRTIFATLGDEVTYSFKIDTHELSTFFAAGMISYPLMQIPGGMLLDRFGPRKMLSLAMASLSVGIIFVSTTENFNIAIFGRILMGIGSAFAFLSTSKIVVMWFPIHMMGFLLGVTVFMGGIGGAFSNAIYAHLGPQDWDWRKSIFSLGSLGILLAAAIFLILRERKAEEGEAQANGSIWSGMVSLLTNKQVLITGFFTFFAYLPISLIADSWGPLAFENLFKVSKDVANQTVTYFYIPFAIGAFAYSAVASWLKNYKGVLIFEFSLAAIAITLLFASPQIGGAEMFGIPLFLLLTGFIGFNLGGVSLAFPLGCAHAPKELAGTTVGLINMVCMISGGIFSKIVGILLHSTWTGEVGPEGNHIYTSQAYQIAMSPLIVTSIIAVVLLFFIVEKKDATPSAGH